MQKHILIIDDEIDICELLSLHLTKACFKTSYLCDALNLGDFLDKNEIDLIIMDVNLISHSGRKAVQNLRQLGYNEPVIFLTANAELNEKLAGLELGDDYITKPFEMNELIARIRAVLKRSGGEFELVKFRDLSLNLEQMSASLKGEILKLTKLEFRLILALIKNQNQILSREFLASEIWGDEVSDKAINIAVKRLRAKLGEMGACIQSVASIGYKIC